jgi:pyruvate dehydrogenase E1 component alpha subunit
LEELQEKIKAEIKDAVQFAEESPLPDPSDLYNDVYVESDYPYITD